MGGAPELDSVQSQGLWGAGHGDLKHLYWDQTLFYLPFSHQDTPQSISGLTVQESLVFQSLSGPALTPTLRCPEDIWT